MEIKALKLFTMEAGLDRDFYNRFSPEFQAFFRKFRVREDTILRISAGIRNHEPSAGTAPSEEILTNGRSLPRVLKVSKSDKQIGGFD
jgi:hypothetical protein